MSLASEDGTRRPFENPVRSINADSPIRPGAGSNAAAHGAHFRARFYGRLAPAYQDNALVMPSHVIPASMFVLASGNGKQSSLVTVLSLWNTMMGTSILTMPWALAQVRDARALPPRTPPDLVLSFANITLVKGPKC